ncbi:hypothetical protein [Streptacidiphilus jiangxiensis]|uniref:Uncharacterized protein n=1 Tax=Streptacidiphilus jiangxiensis TaxID=235985 RepID=A0A1H7ZCI2_STRJI|nr:hypothetical protein [Streptacidiphilus jiangxiensis]SEM56016.1 hypothetical protein SAMN05414137_13427 [Streptacidiphilus jiangxiensis]
MPDEDESNNELLRETVDVRTSGKRERLDQPEARLPCPVGHLSRNLDRCDQCSRDMPVPRCPTCDARWAGRYCEECGYDWLYVGSISQTSESMPPVGRPALREVHYAQPGHAQAVPAPGWEPDALSVAEFLKLQSEPDMVNELIASGVLGAMATSFGVVAKAALEQKTERMKAQLNAETERMRIAAENERAALREREETRRARLQARTAQAQPSSGGSE